MRSERGGENEAFCSKGFLRTWSQEGNCMVSTVIKYNVLCHAWATRRFRREPHDMVICK